MRYLILIFAMIFVHASATAQVATADVGVSIGTNMISGDLSSTDIIGSQGLSIGLIGRYNPNRRIALRATFDYGTAETTGVSPFINDGGTNDYGYSRSFIDLGGMLEFNWFEFIQDRYSNAFSPYIGVGAGFFSANEGYLKEFDDQTYNIRDPYTGDPIEVFDPVVSGYLNVAFGAKYRLNRSISFSAELFAKKMFSDKIDGLDDPYRLFTDVYGNKQFATTSMHNNDWIFGLKFSVLYQFYKGCNVCPN